MGIDTVIFDLGGTLIEYAGAYEHWPELETPGFEAAYTFLVEQNHALPPFTQFRQAGFALLPLMWRAATRHERNLRVTDLLAASLRSIEVNSIPATAVQAAAAHYGQAIQAQAFLVDQAVETVQQVKAAGYKIGLVSNTMFPGEMHRADMARFGLIDSFAALLFSADVFKWKPNADPFLQVLAELGAEADTAVYVGDDPASDVVGGQAAGMRTIYFKSSQRFTKPNGVQPHAEIRRLEELLDVLAGW